MVICMLRISKKGIPYASSSSCHNKLQAQSQVKTCEIKICFFGEPAAMLHRSQLQIGLDLGFFQRFGPTFQFQQLGSRFQRPLTTKACAPQRNFMVEGEDRPAETTWFLELTKNYAQTKKSSESASKILLFCVSRTKTTLVLRTACLLVEQSSQFE